MAPKPYRLIGGNAPTKVITLSPRPVQPPAPVVEEVPEVIANDTDDNSED